MASVSADRAGALDGRRLLVVNACVLLAVALLWNRDALPAWMRVEFAGQDAMVARYSTLQVRAPYRLDQVSLTGRPTLIVGDSMLWNWPWPADRLIFFSKSAPELAAELRDRIADRQYEQVVLWPGTAHFRTGFSIESYVTAVADMVDLAHEHADQVFVIGPMPYDVQWQETQRKELASLRPDQQSGQKLARFSWLDDGGSRDVAARAVAALADRLPGVPVVNAGAFRRGMQDRGILLSHSADGVHLNDAGYALFARELEQAGVQLDGEPGRS